MGFNSAFKGLNCEHSGLRVYKDKETRTLPKLV